MTAQNSFSILQPRDLTFGRGCAGDAVSKVLALGRHVMLVRGRSAPWCNTFAEDLRAAGANVTEVFCTREPHIDDLKDAAATTRDAGCDVIVGVGGGSVIDLAKAVAALVPATHPTLDYVTGGRTLDATPLPFVAIPTTAGTGSEVTRNAVICVPERQQKISLRDTSMIADVALIDPALTDGTPKHVTFGSGLDALVQVIEPYLSNRANAYTDALCRYAIPLGLHALARLAEQECPDARNDMALVSLFGGLALTNAGLGAVHGIAGVVGGRGSGAPHGALCGRLLCATHRVNGERSRALGLNDQRHREVLSWLNDVCPPGSDDTLDRFAAMLNEWELPRVPALEELAQAEDLEVAMNSLTSSSMAANGTRLRLEDVQRIIECSAAYSSKKPMKTISNCLTSALMGPNSGI